MKDPQYIHYKEKLEKVHQEKINGALIRNYVDWYQHGGKSSNILNVEKRHAIQNQIRTISCNEKKSQPAITCSKLTIETLEQGKKYVQS